MSDRRERAGGGVVLLVVAVLALMVGGGWAAAYYRAAGTLAHGTTIDGIDVGGRTPAEAVEVLRPAMQQRLSRPIAVTTGERTLPVRPSRAGLGIDYGATIDQAGTARSWRPRSLWQHYSDGERLEPVMTVDGPTMAEQVAQLERRLGTTARDGAIVFRRDRVQVTPARVGHQLDPAETAAALESAFRAGSGEAQLILHDVVPRIDDRDVQRAIDRVVNPALSGAVRLRFGDTPVRLQPREFTAALSLRAVDGRLVPRVDPDVLARLVGGPATYARPPVDATVALVDGRPAVVPPRPGASYTDRAVADAFQAAVGRDLGQRTARVRERTVRPEVTAREARSWGIRTQVGAAALRVVGDRLAPVVAQLDQTVLAPGDELDVGRALGDLADTRGVGRLSHALAVAAGESGLTVSNGGAGLRVGNRSEYGALLHVTLRGSGPVRTLRIELWSHG